MKGCGEVREPVSNITSIPPTRISCLPRTTKIIYLILLIHRRRRHKQVHQAPLLLHQFDWTQCPMLGIK
jgi:hypothetical protein